MFFFAGMLAIVFNQCCFTIGLSLTSPVNASIVTTTLPIVTMILAALFLKTRNIWGIALVHGLNDLFVMLGDALFSGTTSTTYVNNDAMMASASVVMYGVFFLLYIPIIVSTVRMLKQVETPCKGPFADRWS